MISLDSIVITSILCGLAFIAGRFTAPKTITHSNTDVTINLPQDAAKLEGLDIDHPVARITADITATNLSLAKAKVWLRAYELACDNGHTDCPEDEADRAVQVCFD